MTTHGVNPTNTAIAKDFSESYVSSEDGMKDVEVMMSQYPRMEKDIAIEHVKYDAFQLMLIELGKAKEIERARKISFYQNAAVIVWGIVLYFILSAILR